MYDDTCLSVSCGVEGCVCVFSVFLMECLWSVFYCHNWIHRWRTFDAILYREELTQLCRFKCSETQDWCPRGNQITQNANQIVHLSSAGTPRPLLSSHLVPERRVQTEIWINLFKFYIDAIASPQSCSAATSVRFMWGNASCFSWMTLSLQSQWLWGGNIGLMNKPWGLYPPFRNSKDVFLSLLLFNFNFFEEKNLKYSKRLQWRLGGQFECELDMLLWAPQQPVRGTETHRPVAE